MENCAGRHCEVTFGCFHFGPRRAGRLCDVTFGCYRTVRPRQQHAFDLSRYWCWEAAPWENCAGRHCGVTFGCFHFGPRRAGCLCDVTFGCYRTVRPRHRPCAGAELSAVAPTAAADDSHCLSSRSRRTRRHRPLPAASCRRVRPRPQQLEAPTPTVMPPQRSATDEASSQQSGRHRSGRPRQHYAFDLSRYWCCEAAQWQNCAKRHCEVTFGCFHFGPGQYYTCSTSAFE